VHFTSDGSRLVTNEHLIVYRLDYKVRMRDHRHNISAVTFAEFSPDGNTLLTASLDGTLRLWPMDPMALAMRRLSRDMTKSEKVKLGGDLAGN